MSKISNLSFHCKEIEKVLQIKPKIRKRQKIIEITVEFHKIEKWT